MRTITIFLSAILYLPAAFAAEGTFPVDDRFLSVDLDQLRFPNLCIANAALSQLSYIPKRLPKRVLPCGFYLLGDEPPSPHPYPVTPSNGSPSMALADTGMRWVYPKS